MRCYMHIGTEKTGTSTIQEFLYQNKKNLSNYGAIFTESAGDRNDRNLAISAYDLDRHDDLTRENHIKTGEELRHFQKETVQNLKTEIHARAVSKKPKIVIFSSEHIHSRLTRTEEILRIKKILTSLGIDKIFVVIYLRNPAALANSLYSTAIKAGRLDKAPPPPMSLQHLCDHRSTLMNYESVFGESYLIPRIYHRSVLISQSIIDDFLHVLGIPLDNSFVIPENKNTSLSITGVKILRKVNMLVPRFINNTPNPARANIVSYFEKNCASSKYVMPKELWEEYDAAFHESNEWVRKKYFPERDTLFPPVHARTESISNMSEEEIDEIANLIVNIWLEKRNLREGEQLSRSWLSETFRHFFSKKL